MITYLIEYNRKTGDCMVTPFSGPTGRRDALKQRFIRDDTRESRDWENVTLHSDSLESIKQTHSRYFFGNVTYAS